MSCTTTFWPGGGREELGESESFVKSSILLVVFWGVLSVLDTALKDKVLAK